MTLTDELTAIKTVEDKLTANKVANFAYTDTAYNDPDTYADGVQTYDPEGEQNIPVANASVLKVNATILTKGWRAQASSITRMLMNHFLGRCSYNLNKINDLFSLLLVKLMAYLGQPNGIATLDNDGHLIQQSPVGSPYVTMTRGFLGAVFGKLLGKVWKQGTGTNTATEIETPKYANGLWVAGSNGHGIWWSEDGKSWTQGTGIDNTYTVYQLYYVNGLWFGSVSGQGLWWSEDGKSWTYIARIKTVSSISIYCLAYANGMWVLGSNSGSGMWYSSIDDLIADGTIDLGADIPLVN